MQKRVRAIVIRGPEILLLERIKPSETYWVFPGGGVETGETLDDALVREVMEETGVLVKVGAMVYSHVFRFSPEESDQEEFYFVCFPVGGQLGAGTGPEFTDPKYKGSHIPRYVTRDKLAALDIRRGKIKDLVLSPEFLGYFQTSG